jgi:uncharacterized membrane protein (DUF485 family)
MFSHCVCLVMYSLLFLMYPVIIHVVYYNSQFLARRKDSNKIMFTLKLFNLQYKCPIVRQTVYIRYHR